MNLTEIVNKVKEQRDEYEESLSLEDDFPSDHADRFLEDLAERLAHEVMDRNEERSASEVVQRIEGHVERAEAAAPDENQRHRLTALYALRFPDGSLAGWSRYVVLNADMTEQEFWDEFRTCNGSWR